VPGHIQVPPQAAAGPGRHSHFPKKNNMHNKKNNIEVGRFLVSPMSQARQGGGFDALVSIRSGRGMASVDRVMRFTPQFSSPQAAMHYARAEGLAWASSH
jgi:hypothetical protein